MVVAQFVFTKLSNAFKIDILNLEDLSVEQIQEIENFVKQRKGIFNFNTYSFNIHKNIEFNKFVSLMDHLKINCSCGENIPYAEPSSRIGFGQYKGMFFSDLDDNYLLWLKSNYRGSQREFIDDELKKRRL